MATKEQSLTILVPIFLVGLAHANHSPQMYRVYVADLAQSCAFHHELVQTFTAEELQIFFRKHTHLRRATRARKQAAVVRFLTWAEQQELINANPMCKIDRVKLHPLSPRGVERSQVECILQTIPAECLCGQLFFRLLSEISLWVCEGLSLCVEELDFLLDNEYLTVVGKGGKR